MSKLLRFFATMLLLFNGLGAIYGGWSLMADPTGGRLQLPLYHLQHSPFSSYAFPGLVLFVVNGLFSLVISAFVIFRWRGYDRLTIFQGVILTGWIVIQMLMLRVVDRMHFIMGGTGLLLILTGSLLLYLETRAQKHEHALL